MGLNSGVYKLLLVLHLMAAIAGFGPTLLAGVFGAKAKARGGREGQAVSEVTYEVISTWASWLMYSVPVLGILLIITSDDAWKFSQTWISMSFLLFIVSLGIVHGAHLPNLRRMNAVMADLHTAGPPAGGGPPPQVAELEERGKRAALLGGVLNVILVVIVVLMVWKPGV